MPQDFPDQPYLERIREALWRRGLHGNAAVMVGSGFSLNAKPRSASSGSFPTWPALAKTVVTHLYPPHEGSIHHEKALEQAKDISGFLRLAQEYEAAFGREALERLIGEVVPDRQFEPGDLHDLLLELPWADVFTTNWDTLLERAADRVINRKYDVIRMVADIPASMKPRIVKLHGTLATNRPFVFTEDDFRKYPAKQAPFVNLAQQAMMENVFCLLGFSGEDPNFLYWSGWVRDHLYSYSPQIYLIGWLDLPPPRRRMLESRGVIPIDCARLPLRQRWPEDLRDRYSVEWFLWSLTSKEPYPPNNWPRRRSQRSIPGYLEISTEDLQAPRTEPDYPGNSTVKNLSDQLEIWRHNRTLYPGWLIAPQSTRTRLWWKTQGWIPEILRLLPELPDAEKLECLEELNWRVEICLVPLSDGLPEAFEEILALGGTITYDFAESSNSASRSVAELRRCRLNLAVALLRHAREEANGPAFDRWFTILHPFTTNSPDLHSRILYERCLLSLAQLDHQAVENDLAEWPVDTIDTFWKVRKAGLLAEIGRTDEAFGVAREALLEIRRRTRKDVTDVPSLSREGWAMFLAQGFDYYPRGHRDPETNEWKVVHRGIEEEERSEKRWEVLRVHECDAWERIEECRRTITSDPPRSEAREREVWGFDTGHRTRSARLFSTENSNAESLPAYQTRRLIEEVGLPPKVDGLDLAKSLLLRTAVWMAELAPNEALGLILRACDNEGDEVFRFFFTKNRIALLESGRVVSLVDKVEKAIALGIPRAAAAAAQEEVEQTLYWLGRLRVAIELLSRLVIRLVGEHAENILRKALDYCKQPLFHQRHLLIQPLANLVVRSLKTLEAQQTQEYLTQFVDLPVPGEKGFSPRDNRNWPDPLVEIENLKFTSPLITLESARVRRLIELVRLSPEPRPRAHATRRLCVLLQWGLLTEDDKSAFGSALWEHRLPPDGFPAGTDLYDFSFLSLPDPQGLANEVFRRKYLSANSGELSEVYLRNITGARSRKFNFSPADIQQVTERILDWWRRGGLTEASRAEAWRSPFDQEDFQVALTNALAQVIIPYISIVSPLITQIANMVEDLRAACFPVEGIYPALAHLQPERLQDFADRLRQGLASGQRRTSEAAVHAVWWWLHEGHDLSLPEPPEDLVREIALVISLRRSSSLNLALSAAEWILLHASNRAGQRFVDLIAEGLSYLLEEAKYDALPERTAESSFAREEISDVRSRCARLALAATRTENDRPVFQEWIRQARLDPLPEVRTALREAEKTAHGS
jgi:hypothetical protein